MAENKIDGEESQGNSSEVGGKKDKKKDSRQRNYAFIVYEDSAFPDWQERLKERHLDGFISPCHDEDYEADGSPKKKHWHVLLSFKGKKSKEQIDAIRQECIGENFNKHLEPLDSLRAYARYLCHLDSPEKAQYSKKDVICLGSMSYDSIIALPGDDEKMMGQIIDHILDNNITSYVLFMKYCKDFCPEWFTMLISRKTYVVLALIKSNAARLSITREEEIARKAGYACGAYLNRETGEVE